MAHWGWYWGVKHRTKFRRILCSNIGLSEIDSFAMYNRSYQTKAVRSDPVKKSLYIPRYGLNAYLQDDDSLWVEYSEGAYKIPVEKKSCNYGGYCYFFRCPKCDKRMRKLYCLEGRFQCRRCGNLSYYSQCVRPTIRYRVAVRRVKKSVQELGGNIDFDEKPPRMHHKTFEKLKARAKYFGARSGQESYKELRLWYGPKIEVWLENYFEYEWKMDVTEYRDRCQKKIGN